MADLLSLLRDYNINKKEIIETESDVIFGDFSWPKTAKTNYVIWGTGKPDTAKDYYTLDCVLFLLRNANLPHIQYVRQALPLGLQVVRLPDRKDLLAYLNGDIASAPSIDRSAPLDISLRQPVQKRPAGLASGASVGGVAGQSADLDSVPDAKRARLNEQSTSERVQRLAAKLDAPAAKPVMVPDQAKGSTLSEAIPLDKIANMRAKFLAKMRQTIKGDELGDIGGGGGVGAEVHQPVLLGGDFDVVRDIVSRERKWKTRVTVLQSSGKRFDSILMMLKAMKTRDDGGSHATQPSGANNSTAASAASQPRQPVHQIQYSRYDQERFLGKEDTQGFKIDTMGTYHGMTLKSVTESAKEDAHRRHAATRGSRLEDPRAALANRTAPSPALPGSVPAKKSRTSRTPIIVIPAAITSMINMYNARDLLQDMKYVSTEDKRSQGCKRDFELLIHRLKAGGTTVPFRVVDQPLKLQRDDWDRVCAVFVQGPMWQFKGWPLGGGNPVEIFSKIKAFHCTWVDMPLDANVRQWNVHVLKLDRHKRHLDRATVQQFWDALDQYMAKAKPHLRF